MFLFQAYGLYCCIGAKPIRKQLVTIYLVSFALYNYIIKQRHTKRLQQSLAKAFFLIQICLMTPSQRLIHKEQKVCIAISRPFNSSSRSDFSLKDFSAPLSNIELNLTKVKSSFNLYHPACRETVM